MKGIVKVGGYGEKRDRLRLATPRASKSANVYGLSVDVFIFPILLPIIGFLVPLPNSLATNDLKSAEQAVEVMGHKLETVSRYRCKLHTVSISGSLQEERIIDYTFRRPRLIQMRILSGKNRGSALVYKNGVVRGHRGGLLSWIVLTFKPSDPDVTTIRGGRVDQSDFLFIMDVLRNAMKEGKLRLENTTGSLNGKEHYRLSLLQHVDPLEKGAEAGTFWIDSEDLVVSKYELYDKNGQLIYRQIHDQLELNAPLPDGQFKL